MNDQRITKLAKMVVNHSCRLAKQEKVLIEGIGVPKEVIISFIRAVTTCGATPFVSIKDDQVMRELCSCYEEKDTKLMADCELHMLKHMDAFIGIRGFMNANEFGDVGSDYIRNVLQNYIQPVHHEYRNKHLKWVALRWPTPSMAQRAGMSTELFEELFFDACTMDYAKLEIAMTPLAEAMGQTDKVRIVGPLDTDISFSIQGMHQYKHAGTHNIPDGELATAPVRDSVNGRIHYNVPSVFYGTTFYDICFDFKEGKVVHAQCNSPKRMNALLDQDPAARYVGEFAFGLNPGLRKPMLDILFDEKMAGSVHLAQGNAYPQCDNGNRSSIHWDLILMQTPDAGGGEIYFDDVLARRDGLFVLDELVHLNPHELLSSELSVGNMGGIDG